MAGFVKKLWERFKAKWIVGAEFADYLPETKGWHQKGAHSYRYPAPGSRAPPDLPVEESLKFDIAYYKRAKKKAMKRAILWDTEDRDHGIYQHHHILKTRKNKRK